MGSVWPVYLSPFCVPHRARIGAVSETDSVLVKRGNYPVNI